MKKASRFWRMFIWTVVLLLAAPAGSQAGGMVGGQFTISADSINEAAVSLAYNPDRDEYLAVWYNDRTGCDDIRAQRVGADGALVGPSFYISAGCDYERRYPDVAYNSGHQQYLVVWEETHTSNFPTIKGRRVSGTGAVLDGSDLTIQGGSNLYTPSKPAVSYASTSDRYLVVWAETWHPLPITYSIYGQLVTETGALDGSKTTIILCSEPVDEPDLAYNRHADRYLVAWQQNAGTSNVDIYAMQVQGSGMTWGSVITIAYYTAPTTLPAVAAIPTTPDNYKFLVVYQLEYAAGDNDIYARPVQENGTPGTDVHISETGADETSPAVAGSEASGEYLVAWRHPQGVVDQPIQVRPVSHSGTLLAQPGELSGVAADLPALASGAGGDFLAAWQDQPISATDTDIYGALWGNRLYLPVVIR